MVAASNMVRDTRKTLADSPSTGKSSSPKPMPSRPITKPAFHTFKPATFRFPVIAHSSVTKAENTTSHTQRAIKQEPITSPAISAPTSLPFSSGLAQPAEDAKMQSGGGLQTSMLSFPAAAAPVLSNGTRSVTMPFTAINSTKVANASFGSNNTNASHVPFGTNTNSINAPFGARVNHTMMSSSIVVNAALPLNPDIMDAHKLLLSNEHAKDDRNVADEVAGAPVFVDAVRRYAQPLNDPSRIPPFSQYGLLSGDFHGISLPNQAGWVGGADPRIFYNISAPSSVFICGSQGSGKSHTLGCLLENCLVPSEANTLPRPLTGLVFHYDSFVSDAAGSPCEAAYLSSKTGVKVRVLCSPTNTAQIKVRLCSLTDLPIFYSPLTCLNPHGSEFTPSSPMWLSRSSASTRPTSTRSACWISWPSILTRATACPSICL